MVPFLIGVSSQGEFLVEISGTTVTITCPIDDDDIQWTLSGTAQATKERKFTIRDHDSKSANLSCSLGNRKHELYLNAKGERRPLTLHMPVAGLRS